MAQAMKELLVNIEAESGNRSAIVYINLSASGQATPKQTGAAAQNVPQNVPEVLVVTAEGSPLKVTLPKLEAGKLVETIETFRGNIISSARRGGDYYLASAQQLYQWLIAPLEETLEAADIDTLVFSMDQGIRTLPIAALHDGEQFLVEKYSLGMVPAVSLIDPQYRSLADAEVLAMGVSDFERLAPLPAVPLELELINAMWPGSAFLNESSVVLI